VHENDAARLLELRRRIDGVYSRDLGRDARALCSSVRGSAPEFDAGRLNDGDPGTYWAAEDGAGEPWVALELGAPAAIDRVVLREPIALGQRISSFVVETRRGGAWREAARGTTVGNRRIVRLEQGAAALDTPVEALRVRILGARATATLSSFELYQTPRTK
jgi:alpha-L-fucosidase